MTTDQARLAEYVSTWRSAVGDVLALLESLEAEDWAAPTDLPGWDVRAVAAHLAHLEAELAGRPQSPVQVPELAHVRSAMSAYTEQGPLARAGWPVGRIVEELAECTAERAAELAADPPTDPHAEPPRTPGGVPWSWETLLSNRPLDVWMHEQDIRRAVGRPGGLDTPGAVHTIDVLSRSFGYVVGKRVGPEAGTTAVLDVAGAHPVRVAVRVDDSGRAVPASVDGSPTVSLAMGPEWFVRLAGGRCDPATADVDLRGDEALGRRILAVMAVTP